MYQVSNAAALLRGHRRLLSRDDSGPRVNRTVVLLGLTSLFTDIAAEMVVTVLPLYLVYVGQFSPIAFGFVDGLQRGGAALVGLASGFIGDRFRRHKDVATAGYGLSAVVKLGLATAGTAFSTIGALVLLDRIGKGIRTAPRDAMISLSTPKEDLGVAFGVHRALDTTGAMLGPLVAFGILAIAANAFESVFLVSFCIAMIGLGIIVLLVPRQDGRIVADPEDAEEPDKPTPVLQGALVLLKIPRFRALLIAGGALSLATASDAFIFLLLQDKLDLSLTLFPLLFVGMALVYMLLAVPVGRLADRIGRGRVLLAGYALLLCVYAGLLVPIDGTLLVALTLALLGAYYAGTDGVLMAFGSSIVPDDVRGSGLALIGTMVGVSRLLASVFLGALWLWVGSDAAIAIFAGGLVVAMMLAARPSPTRESPRMDKRTRLFVALVVVCLAVAGVAIAGAISSDDIKVSKQAKDVVLEATKAKRPALLFRNLNRAQPASYGQVAFSGLPPGKRTLVPLRCERVYFEAEHGAVPGARQRVRIQLPREDLRLGSARARRGQGRGDPEPRARLARRPLRRRDAVRQRPLLRRPARLLHHDDAHRPRQGHEDR